MNTLCVRSRLAAVWCLLIWLALSVAVPAQPIILTQPEDTAVPASATARFFVYTDGSQTSFQWRREESNLQDATNYVLTLTNVSSADAGLYKVVITNAMGAVTSAPARLVVVPVLPGMVDPSFDPGLGPDGVARATAITTNGFIYLAGEFATYGGVPRSGIVRLFPDGMLDPTFEPGTGADSGVYAVALQPDGKILLGGAFSAFNGVAAPHIVRLTTNGAVDQTFNAGSGPSAAVWSIAIETGGSIVIGGDFSLVADTARVGLARLSASGELDPGYAPQITGQVRRVFLQPDGSTLVAGGFYVGQGSYGNNFARVTSAGVVDSTFNQGFGPNAWVTAIANAGAGQSYIGGSFSLINGVYRPGLARMTSSGSVDPAFAPTWPYSVVALAVQSDGKLLAGGGFWGFDSEVGRYITRLLPAGDLDPIFYGSADDWVESVQVLPDQRILIAGAFNKVGDWNRPRIARLFGGDPLPFLPAFVRQPPAAAAYREGMDVVLSAKVLAYPAPAYQWQFNGQNIAGKTTTSLVLSNVHVQSAGDYTLIASNVVGSTTSRVAVVTVSPARTNAGAVDIEFYTGSGPDSAVRAVVPLPDRKVLIGGWFSQVNGTSRRYVARLHPDGSVDSGFAPSFDWFVNTLVRLDSGKIMAGGSFTTVNGAPKPGLVRLLENGDVDPGFHAAFNDVVTINTIVPETNGSVIALGYFTSISGVPRWDLARFTSTGALDPSFNVGTGTDGWISDAALQGDRIVLVGEFTRVNGVRANNIARLNNDGSVDLTFRSGTGAGATIESLVVQTNGRIIIAGQFRSYNGVERHQLARLNADGSLDPSFDPGPGPNAEVNAVAVQSDGKILAGGAFQFVSSRSYSYFARFNPDGSPDLTFNVGTGANGPVYAIAEAEPGRVYIGGSFVYVDDLPRPYVARIISEQSAPFSPVIVGEPESSVVKAGSDLTLSVEAAAVPVPSYQWRFNGSNIAGATQWVLHLRNVDAAKAGSYAVTVSNPNGTAESSPATLVIAPPSRYAGAPDISFHLGAAPNGPVRALAVGTNDAVVIAGDFTEIGGLPFRRIARLQPNGAPDLSFTPGSGADDDITAMTLQTNGTILIAGAFKHYNGLARTNLARLLPNGTLDSSFVPAAIGPGNIYALATQPDGRILVGGYFQRVDGIERLSLARFHPNGALDASFVPMLNSNSYVLALGLQPDGRIVVGGSFYLQNFYNNITRLNANGSIDATYLSTAASAPVTAINVSEATNIVIGGSFSSVNGIPSQRIALLTARGAVDTNFINTNFMWGDVRALLTFPDSNILAGGTFSFVGTQYVGRVARFTPRGGLDPSFKPGAGAEGGSAAADEYGSIQDHSSVLAFGVQSNGRILVGGDFTTFDEMARPHVARIFSRDAADKLFLSASGPEIELRWDTGVLQGADGVSGPWATVTNATSPFRVPTSGLQKFYRLKFTEQPPTGTGQP